ncbi:MAG TPA: metal-sensitive transcriptional regulator [Candidatus Omnitrophota bacterium]|nr:metal-sensitive transcriptional regulator [Candidatus Omnitrophota bacterium]
MKKGTSQADKLVALRRIEGQVRGIQRMIEERRYCIDILNATEAIHGALRNVETQILRGHLDACVKNAFSGTSETDKDRKIREVYELFSRIKK